MKTVMQKLVDTMNKDQVSFTEWFQDNYELLIEKEKEQIKDAWDAGMSEGIGTMMADLDWDGDFTNYLNETYNQNK